MKRFFLWFVGLGIILAFLASQFSPLASRVAQATQPTSVQTSLQGSETGEFESIVLDFLETPEVLSQLPDSLSLLGQLST